MRSIATLLAVLVALAAPALGAKPMTVELLRQTLVTAKAAHRADDAVMQQLSNVSLTARLTGTALQQLLAISPGPKSTQALQVIAGVSAFLEPPLNELPPKPAPDLATQKAIMGRTVDYVSQTMPALPNFLAMRVTEHYVDTLRGISGQSLPRGGLLLTGTDHSSIGFSDGRETDDPALLVSMASPEKKGHAKDSATHAPIEG